MKISKFYATWGPILGLTSEDRRSQNKTPHPNKTNAAFKMQVRNEFKANVFSLRFETLRYSNHAYLPYD